jgi:carboxyl-terminal processing protease
MRKYFFLTAIFCLINFSFLLNEKHLLAMGNAANTEDSMKSENSSPQVVYDEYVKFFTEVYQKMQENYYFPVTQENFQRFIVAFNTKIFPQLKNENKSSNYIRWRSAAYLVDFLKDPEDIFSAFMPPQAAKEYEEEVLGKRIDLGIEGTLVPQGYQVTKIEPRSDAFEKGLRERDVVLKIDGQEVVGLAPEKIQELLTPLEGAKVVLAYFDQARQVEAMLEVVSKEYFKQTVFMHPTKDPKIFYVQIQRFNRMTAEDLTRYMTYILQQGASGLILDLRGNPGGPPLAAREISAFFLTPREEFAYFQRKDKPRAVLDVPAIPERFHYQGDIVILVNKESGSASELFSGILQGRKRAVIMGTNTAGQVFLKSMFYFSDDSMVLLVTARGFHPDGTVFSFQGVSPDQPVSNPEADLVNYATDYLISLRGKNK